MTVSPLLTIARLPPPGERRTQSVLPPVLMIPVGSSIGVGVNVGSGVAVGVGVGVDVGAGVGVAVGATSSV